MSIKQKVIMHKDRLLVIILSLIGISTTFMPWIYCPRIETVLYGYYGAGVVTGFMCLLILLCTISKQSKKAFSLMPLLFILILSSFPVVYFVYSYFDLIESVERMDTSNPYLLTAVAGVRFDYGFILLAISMTLTFTFASFRLVQMFMAPKVSKIQ